MKILLIAFLLALGWNTHAETIESRDGLEVANPECIDYLLSINNDSGHPLEKTALSELIEGRFKSCGIKATALSKAPSSPFLHVIITAYPQAFSTLISFHRKVCFSVEGKEFDTTASTWSDGTFGLSSSQEIINRGVLAYIDQFINTFKNSNY
jgi:hypothetical protein